LIFSEISKIKKEKNPKKFKNKLSFQKQKIFCFHAYNQILKVFHAYFLKEYKMNIVTDL
jgi:hypothetical protein